ncbi:hypothetical protein NT6N_37010 [Oceaniferula spumae]|uniref:MipA/OmpV family protein n=1 Tax=Oceaniferula spumae TaxID=2979115 RepID=A0AAT9FRN9_9BACT
MKYALPLALLVACLPAQLSADVENDIPLGIEAVTGFRSEYVYRGFTLAEDSVLDFQIEAEIALNDHTLLNVGGWYATETGRGDYDEAAGFAKLRFLKSEKLTIGLSATYRSFNHSVFEDGVDLGIFGTYEFCKDFGITAGAYYDTGAEAWYANVETNWSKTISDKAYFSLKTGVSYVNDYYGRDGINDVYSRLSLTYHISEAVSVTPFIGASLLIDDDSTVPGVINDDSAYGGIWFVVRF